MQDFLMKTNGLRCFFQAATKYYKRCNDKDGFHVMISSFCNFCNLNTGIIGIFGIWAIGALIDVPRDTR